MSLFVALRRGVLLLAAAAAGCGGTADEASDGASTPQSVAPATGSGYITGLVFEDRNENGNYDTGDVRMAQQRVVLTDPSGSQQLQSATTGPDGSFRLERLGAGDYRLTLQVPDGFARANDDSFVLTVPEDGSPAEVQFGMVAR